MGCIRNLGCLVVLLIVLAVGWLYRDRWMPRDREERTTTATAGAAEWEPLTAAGATRTRGAIEKLERRSGPVFVSLEPEDVAAYILEETSAQLVPSAENVTASVAGDRLYVRATVKPSEVGGARVLGPQARILGEQEVIQFGGVVEVVRPGLAQYRVREVKIRDFSLPSGLIPKIIRDLRPDSVPADIAADAVPVEIPAHVGDIRISDGKVILYKATR